MKYVIVLLALGVSFWYNCHNDIVRDRMDIQMHFDKVDFHKHGIEHPEYKSKTMVA